MYFNSTRIPYRQTGFFTNIVLDYLDQAEQLTPFFSFAPGLQGIQKAVEERKKHTVDRKALVAELKKQYSGVAAGTAVQNNIEALLSEKTFTITTAHQPNIFTGPVYFIYKIIHAVKLAAYCKESLPAYNFVPVFCMGSEDADLDELGHIFLGGKKQEWKTKQTGAVGRMKIDQEFIKLINSIAGQLDVQPFGKEMMSIVKECYQEGAMVQDATFRFVNTLFGEYGLVVLIPDSAALKKQMIPVFEDDLLNQTASGILEKTIEKLNTAGYKVQVNPRAINLFYLNDNLRERIESLSTKYSVLNTEISFSKDELIAELKGHPERFSPNVILRGLFQCTVLPDIAFIGGGGEIAYWLELRELFEHYKSPFPVLVLRNSFLIMEKKWKDKLNGLGLTMDDLFLSEEKLVTRLVKKESKQAVKLNGVFSNAEEFYNKIKNQAASVDSTLAQHVDALKQQSLHRLHELEKKMLRAEKKKFTSQQRQIRILKETLFPNKGLQERQDNLLYYYSRWGREFIHALYEQAQGLEQEFMVLQEK